RELGPNPITLPRPLSMSARRAGARLARDRERCYSAEVRAWKRARPRGFRLGDRSTGDGEPRGSRRSSSALVLEVAPRSARRGARAVERDNGARSEDEMPREDDLLDFDIDYGDGGKGGQQPQQPAQGWPAPAGGDPFAPPGGDPFGDPFGGDPFGG